MQTCVIPTRTIIQIKLTDSCNITTYVANWLSSVCTYVCTNKYIKYFHSCDSFEFKLHEDKSSRLNLNEANNNMKLQSLKICSEHVIKNNKFLLEQKCNYEIHKK